MFAWVWTWFCIESLINKIIGRTNMNVLEEKKPTWIVLIQQQILSSNMRHKMETVKSVGVVKGAFGGRFLGWSVFCTIPTASSAYLVSMCDLHHLLVSHSARFANVCVCVCVRARWGVTFRMAALWRIIKDTAGHNIGPVHSNISWRWKERWSVRGNLQFLLRRLWPYLCAGSKPYKNQIFLSPERR